MSQCQYCRQPTEAGTCKPCLALEEAIYERLGSARAILGTTIDRLTLEWAVGDLKKVEAVPTYLVVVRFREAPSVDVRYDIPQTEFDVKKLPALGLESVPVLVKKLMQP